MGIAFDRTMSNPFEEPPPRRYASVRPLLAREERRILGMGIALLVSLLFAVEIAVFAPQTIPFLGIPLSSAMAFFGAAVWRVFRSVRLFRNGVATRARIAHTDVRWGAGSRGIIRMEIEYFVGEPFVAWLSATCARGDEPSVGAHTPAVVSEKSPSDVAVIFPDMGLVSGRGRPTRTSE